MIVGAFYQSGQSCIGVQRIIVHETSRRTFRERFVAATRARMGDPEGRGHLHRPHDLREGGRAARGLDRRGRAAGAKSCAAAPATGNMLEATVLEDVPRDQKLYREEAFGPVAVLSKFTDFTEAIAEVNDSAYGLQVGVFTRDLPSAPCTPGTKPSSAASSSTTCPPGASTTCPTAASRTAASAARASVGPSRT
jgi:acyl-CoA reductase-like NAD-dependent aldehyde dehydrogenase